MQVVTTTCADEADMVAKVRMATAVQPIVSALYANSSLSEGRANGFVSRRLEAWRAAFAFAFRAATWVYPSRPALASRSRTVCRNDSGSNGFTRYASAPSSRPRTLRIRSPRRSPRPTKPADASSYANVNRT